MINLLNPVLSGRIGEDRVMVPLAPKSGGAMRKHTPLSGESTTLIFASPENQTQAAIEYGCLLLVVVSATFHLWSNMSCGTTWFASDTTTLVMGTVTWKTLDERISQGRGQGHRDWYLPWIWIRRKNVSGQGNQVVDSMPSYRRGSHFLAQVEWHVALLCLYLGAWDVREQFPLWPQPHVHTLADVGLQQVHNARLPDSGGLLRIAKDAGIDHGWEIGSDAPYVATLDLAATLVRKSTVKLAGISLKPHDLIETAEADDRIVERLELERRYVAEADGHHVIADRSTIGPHTGGNLETFSGGARLPVHLNVATLISDYCCRLVEVATETSISAGINRVGAAMGLSKGDANFLWRHGVWNRLIDIDITRPLEMGMPLQLGGAAIANKLSQQLFGEVLR